MAELDMEPRAQTRGNCGTSAEGKIEDVQPGQHYGRWSILDKVERAGKGERKWLCRCTCGTERYVLERSLKYGGSQSCGCLREETLSTSIAHKIDGQTFGDLTVIERSDAYHKNGGIWWKCRCSCGNICEAPATVLVKGRKTHCGCKTEKDYYFSDITNQRFDRLVALFNTDKRDSTGGMIWHCRCDCGNEIDVSYNNLMYANQVSCGCKKKEHDQKLREYQTHLGNTSLDHIRSTKIPKDNTTGAKGVYFIKGKYVAKLVFQKKAYYLGTYNNFEDAKKSREEAEEAIFHATLDYHARWKKKAEADPFWGKKNPIQIFVERRDGRLHTSFLPILDK